MLGDVAGEHQWCFIFARPTRGRNQSSFSTVGATIRSPGGSAHDDSMVDDKPCISILADLSRGIQVDLSYA